MTLQILADCPLALFKLNYKKIEQVTVQLGRYLGARSIRTAVPFGQHLLRFSLDYFHKKTITVKIDIRNINYNSIFPPENHYNLTVKQPF